MTPSTMANVTAICRAGVDKLSGNGRGGLGKVKRSLEPAHLFLTPKFSMSEPTLELLEYPPDARCSAGVNPQNKHRNERIPRIRQVVWLGQGTQLGDWASLVGPHKPKAYQIYVLLSLIILQVEPGTL